MSHALMLVLFSFTTSLFAEDASSSVSFSTFNFDAYQKSNRAPNDIFRQKLREDPNFRAEVKKSSKAPNQVAILPLDVAIQEVSEALNTYRTLQAENPALPPLKTVKFDFKVTTTKMLGLSLNLFIITIGGKTQTQDVNDMKFTYSLPPATPTPAPTPGEKGTEFAGKTQTLKENLVTRIKEAAAAAKNKFHWGGQDWDQAIEIELDYGIEVQLSGALQIPVYTLTVGPSASWDKNAVQSVTLDFEKPSPTPKPKTPTPVPSP